MLFTLMAGSSCSGCESDRILERFDKDSCEINIRTYVAYRPVLFKCNLTFDNILDTAEGGEWDTALGNGDIILFPSCGKLEIQQGTTNIVDTDECGNNILGTTTFPWTYTNPNTSVDFEDEAWYADVKKKLPFYKWGFIRQCEGEEARIYLNDAAKEAIAAGGTVATNNPGIGFSLTRIPQWAGPNGVGEAGRWEMAGEFKGNCAPVGCPLPGLQEILSNY